MNHKQRHTLGKLTGGRGDECGRFLPRVSGRLEHQDALFREQRRTQHFSKFMFGDFTRPDPRDRHVLARLLADRGRDLADHATGQEVVVAEQQM